MLALALGLPLAGCLMSVGQGQLGAVSPDKLLLARFDLYFRKIGPIFAFLPFVLRFVGCWVCPRSCDYEMKFSRPLLSSVLHFTFFMLRTAIYRCHKWGQSSGMWTSMTAQLTDHIMADHVFLAVSVQASCMFEAAAATRMLHSVCSLSDPDDKNALPYNRFSKWALRCSVFTALATASVIACDMYYTSRYFHYCVETSASLFLGLPLFLLPAAYSIWCL